MSSRFVQPESFEDALTALQAGLLWYNVGNPTEGYWEPEKDSEELFTHFYRDAEDNLAAGITNKLLPKHWAILVEEDDWDDSLGSTT